MTVLPGIIIAIFGTLIYSRLDKLIEEKQGRVRVIRQLRSLSTIFNKLYDDNMKIIPTEEEKKAESLINLLFLVPAIISMGIAAIIINDKSTNYSNGGFIMIYLILLLLLPNVLLDFKKLNSYSGYAVRGLRRLNLFSPIVMSFMFLAFAVGKPLAEFNYLLYLGILTLVMVVFFVLPVKSSHPVSFYENLVFKERFKGHLLRIKVLVGQYPITGNLTDIDDSILLNDDGNYWSIEWSKVNGVAVVSENVLK